MVTNRDDADTLPWGSIETITEDETLMILVPRPGEESTACGGLIAGCCRRGRPPFVMILGDGTASSPHSNSLSPHSLAIVHERQSREAAGLLGLDDDRLLMAGLFDGTIPDQAGASFDSVVRGVIQVMWRTDCNIICSPWPRGGDPAHLATHEIAAEVSVRSGVGHRSYLDSPTLAARLPFPALAWRLDIAAHLGAKRNAIEAHRALRGPGLLHGSPLSPAADDVAAPFEIVLAVGP